MGISLSLKVSMDLLIYLLKIIVYSVGLFMLLMCCILYFISYIFFYPSDVKRNDININIPNDYSFNYKPYEVQTNEQSEQMAIKEQISSKNHKHQHHREDQVLCQFQHKLI